MIPKEPLDGIISITKQGEYEVFGPYVMVTTQLRFFYGLRGDRFEMDEVDPVAPGPGRKRSQFEFGVPLES